MLKKLSTRNNTRLLAKFLNLLFHILIINQRSVGNRQFYCQRKNRYYYQVNVFAKYLFLAVNLTTQAVSFKCLSVHIIVYKRNKLTSRVK